MIKLKNLTAKTYIGNARYFILYDEMSGNKNRYKVLLDNSKEPIVIGRELDLKTVRNLIEDCEKELDKIVFFGDRKTALKFFNIVLEKRRAK